MFNGAFKILLHSTVHTYLLGSLRNLFKTLLPSTVHTYLVRSVSVSVLCLIIPRPTQIKSFKFHKLKFPRTTWSAVNQLFPKQKCIV